MLHKRGLHRFLRTMFLSKMLKHGIEDHQTLPSWHKIHVFNLLPFPTLVSSCCLFIYAQAYVLASQTPLHISHIPFWPWLPFFLAQAGSQNLPCSFQPCLPPRMCKAWRQRFPPSPKSCKARRQPSSPCTQSCLAAKREPDTPDICFSARAQVF